MSPTTTVKKGNKYGAHQFYWSPTTQAKYDYRASPDCIRFDSNWEHRVYLAVASLVPRECITLHEAIDMKPKTKRYPAIPLNVDIVVKGNVINPWVPYLLIEPKGVPTPEFRRNLKMLEYFNPEAFERLIIVGDYKPLKIDGNKTTVTLDTLVTLLMSCKNNILKTA